MQIGVDQFPVFHAGGACSAGIPVCPVLAVNIAGVSNCHRQASGPFRPQKKLGMADALIGNALKQFFLDCFLSGYVAEKHVLGFETRKRRQAKVDKPRHFLNPGGEFLYRPTTSRSCFLNEMLKMQSKAPGLLIFAK